MVFTVVLLALAPHHYHLHHDAASDPLQHAHSIHLHILSDANGDAHHDQATALKATPNVLAKSVGDNPLNVAFALILLALLPVREPRIRLRLGHAWARLRPAFYQLSPPLRAPPRP
jgi:hypothetical protein